MIQSLRVAVSALAFSIALTGVAVAQTPVKTDVFTAKDMASLDRLSDPRVSPDGRHVLYSVRTMDYPANKASMSLWVADLKTKMAPRRLTISDGGASGGRWSADGKVIYFTSSRAGGTEQVFKTDVTGETATQVTATPFDVQAYKVAPNGKTIVVAMAVFPDCPDLACTEARLAAKTATIIPKTPTVAGSPEAKPFRVIAQATEVSAIWEPALKSMPPLVITMVMPSAPIPTMTV